MTQTAVAFCNVPSKVKYDGWKISWNKCKDQPGGVFGINETFLRECKELYLTLARQNGWGVAGTRSPNWIFWDRKIWKRVKSKVVKLHDAGTGRLAIAYPGYNAARFATVLTLKNRRTGEIQTFILTHLVVLPGKYVPADWQREVKGQSIITLRQLIRDELKAGRPTWLFGDMNTHGELAMGMERFRWIKPLGIDKVGLALPGGYALDKSHTTWANFNARTDHPDGGVRAKARWKKI